MKFKQITSHGRPIQLTPRFGADRLLAFGYLKVMLEGSPLETEEELQEKVTDILTFDPTPTFRKVFEEWKSRLLQCIEADREYFLKDPFSTIYIYHKRR
jgi:hypothetical protein